MVIRPFLNHKLVRRDMTLSKTHGEVVEYPADSAARYSLALRLTSHSSVRRLEKA
jgi:hypothetical protein